MKTIMVFLFLFCLVVNYCYGGNVAEIRQSGQGENIAIIEQNGNDNTAIVEQGSFSGFFRDFLGKDPAVYPFPYQLGRESQTRLFVKGNNNFVFQYQRGRNNFATLFVQGSGNMVRQAQVGEGNRSFAEVFGNFDILFYLQHGNGFISPRISIVGDGRKMYIIQK